MTGRGSEDVRAVWKLKISLVLLDIIMPKMDGFEVLAYMNRDKWIEGYTGDHDFQ